MEKQTLKQIISTHKERFLSLDRLSPRLISKEDELKILSKEIVIVSGIRRSGKSSLLNLYYHYLSKKFKINKNNILFINFEDERFVHFELDDFEQLYQSYIELYDPKGMKYFFLDEIQNVKSWERWVNRMYEFEDIKIFITGSNASLLQQEFSISLTGRHRSISNYCFSFSEYTILKKTSFTKESLYLDKQQIKLNRLLEQYIHLGGFPEALIRNDINIVDQYFKDIIYRDIIARYKIRNIKELKELTIYLISNTGKLNSYANLRKLINATNTTTIKNYIAALEDAFLIHALPLFDYSIKKQIYNVNKYYVNDIGFYHAVGFSFSADYGRLLENMVLIDLLRQEKEVYYWKSSKGLEVDFVVQEKKNISQAIQVCYHLNNENTEREVRSLIAANEELDASELLIISREQNRTIHISKEDIENKRTDFEVGKPLTIQLVSYLEWLLM